MNTEQLQTIGPWGYLFAFVAFVLALALTRLLMSDPRRMVITVRSELAAVRKELAAARKLIAELKGEVLNWTQHANEQARTIEAQARTIEERDKDIRDLQYARDALKEAVRLKDETIAMQKQIIERGEKFQKEQAEKIEWLVGRVVQLDLEKGITTKLPWT